MQPKGIIHYILLQWLEFLDSFFFFFLVVFKVVTSIGPSMTNNFYQINDPYFKKTCKKLGYWTTYLNDYLTKK